MKEWREYRRYNTQKKQGLRLSLHQWKTYISDSGNPTNPKQIKWKKIYTIILKEAGKKRQIIYMASTIRLVAASSATRRPWNNSFQVLRDNKCQSRVVYQGGNIFLQYILKKNSRRKVWEVWWNGKQRKW